MEKICNSCKQKKPVSQFRKNRPQCKTCVNKVRRAWRTDNPIYRYLKISARARKRHLDLMSQKEFISWHDTQVKVCHYCGCTEDQQKQDPLHAKSCLEIDRKDPNKGYTLDNVVLACSQCNLAKAHFWDYATFKYYIAPAIRDARKSLSK